MAIWRWFSFSQGGICQFPGGYMTYFIPHVGFTQLLTIDPNFLTHPTWDIQGGYPLGYRAVSA